MQSGALIEDPDLILELMLSNRLCITAPSSGGPSTWEPRDEKILELIPNKGNYYLQRLSRFIRLTATTVPIIVVYTKFDLVSSVDRDGVGKGKEGKEFTELPREITRTNMVK